MSAQGTHLEISGRQSGKSTRLIKAAAEHAISQGISIIVVGEGMRDYTKAKLEQEGGARKRNPAIIMSYSKLDSEETRLLENLCPYLPEPRWFFDEFDWYESVPVVSGAYYATTARYLRKHDASEQGDTLLTLVNLLGEPSIQRPSPISKAAALEHYPDETERALLLDGQYMEPGS